MDMKEKLVEILRKTRYEYRRYIAIKDCEKRMAKTDEEFCAVDDSIVGEIPFCADFLIANGVTVQEGKPLEAFLHPVVAHKGLKAKYLVFGAASGREIKNCFVLRPDKDPAAVEALRAYASATDNETLAEDIYNWVGKGNPVQKWISVKDGLPNLIPCDAGTAYSEVVNVLTSGRKVLTAVWDGFDWICDAEFWDAEDEEITHWTTVHLPLPPLPKGE